METIYVCPACQGKSQWPWHGPEHIIHQYPCATTGTGTEFDPSSVLPEGRYRVVDGQIYRIVGPDGF